MSDSSTKDFSFSDFYGGDVGRGGSTVHETPIWKVCRFYSGVGKKEGVMF